MTERLSRTSPTSLGVTRRDAHGFALALALALASPAPACLDQVQETGEDGAQEQLRDFRVTARSELARIDVLLQRLKALAVEYGESARERPNIEALTLRRRSLGRRVEALAIDGRSRWDQTKEDLGAHISDLARDVDAAVETTTSPARRP
jgi:hypothetical protein